MKQKKLILIKLIGIGNNESKRINNNKDEDDSIKKDYKYNEDKCNNNDNDDDDYDENIKNNNDDSGKYDDDWKIEYINVIVRLVSINPGSLNWTWTPPSSSRRK